MVLGMNNTRLERKILLILDFENGFLPTYLPLCAVPSTKFDPRALRVNLLYNLIQSIRIKQKIIKTLKKTSPLKGNFALQS